MIYVFNAKDSISYPMVKKHFRLNDQDVYKMILQDFRKLNERLELKHIRYADLKSALIPNQDKNKQEICLVVDSSKIDSSDYGCFVIDKILPILDQKSTYSILCGDYIDNALLPDAQEALRFALEEVLEKYNDSTFLHSTQYFLIYFNRLSNEQKKAIVEALRPYSWFTGVADVTYQSYFKSYLSYILVPCCIKCKKTFIVPHPEDYPDEANANVRNFPFEKYDFSLVSINGESYWTFLHYKIESILIDKDDIGFSFNALFPKFTSLGQLALNISDETWTKYLVDKELGKGKIVESLGYGANDKEAFMSSILMKIQRSYIYNLRQNEYGDLLFNVCVELPTIHERIRKTTIALRYHPDTGKMDVVTIT